MFKIFRTLREAFRPEMTPSSLVSILAEMNPENLLDDRMNALKNLVQWLRLPVKRSVENREISSLESRHVRFRFLMQFLEHNNKEKEYFIQGLREIFAHGVAVRLYCMTGVSENNGFFSELTDRLMLKILPRVYAEKDLAEIFRLIFTDIEDAHWFEIDGEKVIQGILGLIHQYQLPTENFKLEISDALIILGAQISSIGVSKGIRRRLRQQSLNESSFVKLNKVLNSSPPDTSAIHKEIESCRLDLKRVRDRAETTGVSVDLIYSIERLSSLLSRVEILVQLQHPSEASEQNKIIATFIANLIRDEIHRQGIRGFLDDNIRMLTKKIVERAGEKGEHYIATTAEERKKLFWAASGAGVLTSITALIKSSIALSPWPLMIEGIFIFTNYAVSFLLMQRWHLALSSKTPAYTASALSKRFEEFLQSKETTEVINEARHIARSQLIAAVGNLLWVVPFVMALDGVLYLVKGSHLLSASQGYAIIAKHDLLSSGTFFYAALTGVLLWISSVISGWVENWVVFRNIPQMIAESPLLISLNGLERNHKFALKFASYSGAVAGNLSIAFLLTLPLVFGKFTGIPLDIRHVTLATGTIVLGLQAIPWDLTILPLIFSMLISITTMGLLNFGVSFYFSIRMAATARGVPARYVRLILRRAFFK